LTGGQPVIRSVLGQLERLHPNLPKGSRVLAINDPLPHPNELLFLLRLYFRDQTLEVDQGTSNNGRHGYVLVLMRDHTVPAQSAKAGPRALPRLNKLIRYRILR